MYYKWHLVCVLSAIFILVSTLHQCATRVEYDLQIIFVSEQRTIRNQNDMMQDYAKGLITDATDNGKNGF